MYRGDLADGFAKPGTESLETKLFSEHEIDFNTLAFPVIKESLKLYFTDKKNSQFNIYNGEMRRDDQQITTTTFY